VLTPEWTGDRGKEEKKREDFLEEGAGFSQKGRKKLIVRRGTMKKQARGAKATRSSLKEKGKEAMVKERGGKKKCEKR